MSPVFVRQKCAFVRVDSASVILIPLLAVAIAIAIGYALISIGVVKSIYSSPFVALCAFVSNRVCLRAGMVTAFLSVLAHEFCFAAPYLSLDWPSMEQGLAYGANFAAAYLVARRCPPAPEATARNDGSAPLPFIGTTEQSDKSFWVVAGGRNWTEDVTVGAEYARIYLTEARTPLAWIMRDMVRTGRWTGVEVGFCSVIGRAAAIRRRANHGSLSHDHADDLDSDGSVV